MVEGLFSDESKDKLVTIEIKFMDGEKMIAKKDFSVKVENPSVQKPKGVSDWF